MLLLRLVKLVKLVKLIKLATWNLWHCGEGKRGWERVRGRECGRRRERV
jgi:hypothetical protein